MTPSDIVTITIALSRARSFVERFPQGKADASECGDIYDLCNDAIMSLRKMGTQQPVQMQYRSPLHLQMVGEEDR